MYTFKIKFIVSSSGLKGKGIIFIDNRWLMGQILDSTMFQDLTPSFLTCDTV